MSNNIIVGLDIGTSAIKGVIGAVGKEGEVRIVDAFRHRSAGIRKGMVVDMDDAAGALRAAVEDIRSVSRHALKRVYVNLGSAKVEVRQSKGFVVVSRGDDIISDEDRERVIQASQAINLPSNRDVVHTMPREYIVDGVGEIQDPVGLSGARLEVESFIIHAFSPVIKNLYRCAEEAGFRIYGLIFSPLAIGKAVLSKNQMDLGVASLDIGASTTSLSVYEDGQLVHAKIFPIGSAHITNDIAIGLKIPLAVAENIKLTYGFAAAKEVSRSDKVELAKISAELDGEIPRKFISEIIEIRLREILELVNDELESVQRLAKLPGGVVLTGGGVKMPGMVDLVKREMRLPAQIGAPVDALLRSRTSDMREHFDDPEMAAAFGLLSWGAENLEKKAAPSPVRHTAGFMRFLKQFLP